MDLREYTVIDWAGIWLRAGIGWLLVVLFVGGLALSVAVGVALLLGVLGL